MPAGAPQPLRTASSRRAVDPPAPRKRIGEVLVERGLITEAQVQEALVEQKRTGDRLGAVLAARSDVDEREVVRALSDAFGLPGVDLDELAPDEMVMSKLGERLARETRVAAFELDDYGLHVAFDDSPAPELLERLSKMAKVPVIPYLAAWRQIESFLGRAFAEQYVSAAQTRLIDEQPLDSARVVFTESQIVTGWLGGATLGAFFMVFPAHTLAAMLLALIVFSLLASGYKVWLAAWTLWARMHPDPSISRIDPDTLNERELPVYTILVPLYREAAIVPRIAQGIGGLDYPKTKLDVKLLCEEDDSETIEAIQRLKLPPHFRLIVVPDSLPKTKPKACNVGLVQAEGEFVVIYDAEDRPEPDQLKKAVAAFRSSSRDLVCVQARLNYFNWRQNLLTRWFTCEYSVWFDLMLPGLARAGVPVPLGGTSNHFRREGLLQVLAWDPFNVTEDADLGIRLHKAGFRTAVIDSTTYEEANSAVGNWIRQRSRWIKGYLITWIVHTRRPVKLARQLGLRGFVSFHLMVGGAFVFLVNPVLWTVSVLCALPDTMLNLSALFPGNTEDFALFYGLIGNALFVAFALLGAVARRNWGLVPAALISPLYWALMSIAGWKGFIQIFTKPAFWEKTVHGLDAGHEIDAIVLLPVEAVVR